MAHVSCRPVLGDKVKGTGHNVNKLLSICLCHSSTTTAHLPQVFDITGNSPLTGKYAAKIGILSGYQTAEKKQYISTNVSLEIIVQLLFLSLKFTRKLLTLLFMIITQVLQLAV